MGQRRVHGDSSLESQVELTESTVNSTCCSKTLYKPASKGNPSDKWAPVPPKVPKTFGSNLPTSVYLSPSSVAPSLSTDENSNTPLTTTDQSGKNTHGCPSETKTTLGVMENTPSSTLHQLMESSEKVMKLQHTAAVLITKFNL